MGQTADQLRQEIDQKREDAASKIDQIEARVQDTAQMAKSSVTDTVQQATATVTDTLQQAADTVSGTMQQAKETVTETVEQVKNIDFQKQIEEKPLMVLGAALAGGFVLGGLLGGGKGGGNDGGSSGRTYADQGRPQSGLRANLGTAAKDSGLSDIVSHLSAALMGTVTERIRSAVSQGFPALADKLPPAPDGAKQIQASKPADPAPPPAPTGQDTGSTLRGW